MLNILNFENHYRVFTMSSKLHLYNAFAMFFIRSKSISEARFGLCAGGITSYEFACLNVPFAIICQVKHQLITAKEWEKQEIARNLGLLTKNTPKKLKDT